jgi:hypothetical protein
MVLRGFREILKFYEVIYRKTRENDLNEIEIRRLSIKFWSILLFISDYLGLIIFSVLIIWFLSSNLDYLKYVSNRDEYDKVVLGIGMAGYIGLNFNYFRSQINANS